MNSAKCFNEIAEKYDFTLPKHVQEHYLNKRVKFIKNVSDNGSFLDVGGGTGTLAKRLEEKDFSAVAMDFSLNMCKIMKKRKMLRELYVEIQQIYHLSLESLIQ